MTSPINIFNADERTYNFALMYIPAENVYYETIIRDEDISDLYPYALEKRVIPVSPHTFFAYLQVIIRGLRGLQIETRAERILDYLNQLKGRSAAAAGRFRSAGHPH